MPQPNKIPLAFAASGDKNVIPESTETTGLASWRDGFPAITSAPFSEGGIAPKRADFNGIFYALSQAVMWMQQGGVYVYDANTDYEAGNVVLDVGGLYVANAANGPSSVVVQPSTDTTGATWKLVRLDLATPTAAGYMSAADKTTLDNVATTYLPLSGGSIANSVDSLSLRPGLVEISSSVPFIDFHHANSSTDYSARIINNADGQLQLSISNDASVFPKSLILKSDGTLTWNGKDVAIAETGTWTPVLSGGSTAGSFTYDANTVGYYVKIDKLVYFLCRVVTTDYSVHPTGRVRVTGLPYTSANHNASYSYVNALGYAGGVNSSVMKICGGFVAFNTAYIDLIVQSSDTPWQKNYGAFSSSSSTRYNIQFNSSNKTANLYVAGCYECA